MKHPRFQTVTFLGGGVAAHVYALIADEILDPAPQRYVIIDPVTEAPDRTLCMWGVPQPILKPAVIAEWSRIRFGYGQETICRELGDWAYCQYSAKSIRQLAEQRLHIDRVTKHATDPVSDADLTLDSRPSQPLEHVASLSLLQHFLGWRIHTDVDLFDIGTAVMMDFRTDQSDGACFFYVLPYSATEALVECTVFSATVWSEDLYVQRLQRYIENIIGCKSYTTLSTEQGVIPMNDRRVQRRRSINWISIGSAAGLTKPTTGYTVDRCIRDATAVFTRLERTGDLHVPSESPARFRWYDRLLLRIIRDEPESVSLILWTLFKRNSIQRILSFLDEQTSLLEEVSLFATLPWMPFLRAIIRR